MDSSPAPQGVLSLLEDQDARPFARDPAVATAVKGATRLARVALPSRHIVEHRHPQQAQRMDLRVGASGDHHVGTASSDDARASVIARLEDASPSVIVLLGPWQSIKIEM